MGNPAKPSASPEKVEVDLSFRLLDRADISEQEVSRVLEFLHQAFGGWPHYDPGVPLADHLRWKMESPATPLAAAVGEHNGEIAVFTLFLTQRILIRGQEGLLLRYVDLAVGEDYRGLGVSTAFLKHFAATLKDSYDLTFSDSTHAAVLRWGDNAGGRAVGNRQQGFILPIHLRRFAEQWSAKKRFHPPSLVVALGLRAFRGWRSLAGGRKDRPSSGAIVAIQRFDGRFDSFFEEAAKPFDLIQCRTSEHLNWRYRDPRGGPSSVWAHEDEAGSILGYVVTKVDQDRGYLADLLTLPGRSDVAAVLVEAAVRGLAAAGCTSVTCLLPMHHPSSAVLRAQGFLSKPLNVINVYRNYGLPAEALDFLSLENTSIHYTLGDSDGL